MTYTHVSEPAKKNENDAVRDKKEREAPEPVLYGGFDAVREIAERLIPKFHTEIASSNILYVSRSKAAKSGGKLVPGKVMKVAPLYRYLTISALADQQKNGSMDKSSLPEADFVIEVALDVWNSMPPAQRTALVDHLLARCTGVEDEKSGAMRYAIRPPQVQDFAEVVERNGAWNDDLGEMRDSLMDK